MPKRTRKSSKTKSSSKLILKGPHRSPSPPPLSKDVEDDDVDGFEDVEAVDLTPAVPPKAPAMFLIHWTIFLDKVSKYFNAKMINPTNFDYTTFLEDEQAKLEEKTRPKGYRVQRQQVRASLSFKEARKQDITILDLEDVEGWANLEDILQTWHEDRKKSIRVSIDIKFARNTAPQPVQDFLTDDNGSESLEEEEAPPRKKKTTTTDKHRAAMKDREKLELELDNHVGSLMRRWHCGNAECKNKDGKCLVLKGKHHALDSNHFTVWNRAISTGGANIESPPLRVLHMLDRPSPSTSEPPPPPPQPAPPPTPSASPAPVHVHMGQTPSMPPMLMQSPWQYPSPYMPSPYPPPSPYLPPYQHPYAAPPPPPPPQYPPHYPMHPPRPPSPQLPPNPPSKPAPQPPQRPVSREKESSPVGSDGTGPMELLYQYIDWFKKRVPEYSVSLEDAYKQLRDQLYNVEQIRKAEVQDWRDLDIPLGLGKQLSKRVREWDKQRRTMGTMGGMGAWGKGLM